MKKLLITLLTLGMLLSLAACGGSGSAGGNVQTPEDPPAAGDNSVPDPVPEPEDDPDPAGPEDDPAEIPEEVPEETGGEEGGEEAAEPSQSDPADTAPEDSGSPDEEDGTKSGSEVSSQAPGTDPDPTPDPEPVPEDPEPTPDPEPAEPADLKAIAESLIGRPVSELYDAIGQPLSADYSPSCLDLDSDDGELTYDGFVVYTEGAPDNETVYDVF